MIKKERKNIYSQDLGIDLSSKKEKEYFKWFLACLLFGKPIQQEVAKQTYFELLKEGAVNPETILSKGWDELVRILDNGHYVRYDFSTATKLLDISKQLVEEYKGSVLKLLSKAKNKEEASKLLQKFNGVGPKTTEIFLRDLPKEAI